MTVKLLIYLVLGSFVSLVTLGADYNVWRKHKQQDLSYYSKQSNESAVLAGFYYPTIQEILKRKYVPDKQSVAFWLEGMGLLLIIISFTA